MAGEHRWYLNDCILVFIVFSSFDIVPYREIHMQARLQSFSCLIFLPCQLKPYSPENSKDIEIQVTLSSFLIPPEPFHSNTQIKLALYLFILVETSPANKQTCIFLLFWTGTKQDPLAQTRQYELCHCAASSEDPWTLPEKMRASHHLVLKIKALLN